MSVSSFLVASVVSFEHLIFEPAMFHLIIGNMRFQSSPLSFHQLAILWRNWIIPDLGRLGEPLQYYFPQFLKYIH